MNKNITTHGAEEFILINSQKLNPRQETEKEQEEEEE